MFPHRTRREFLGAGLVGTLGFALSPAFQRLLAKEGPARRAKACVLVWLNGGPSHLDTFDLKPDAPDDVRGTFKPIDTAAPGVRLCEHLPQLAKQARDLAVVRSLTSKEGDHDRAYHLLHTGNLRDETVEYPSLGSVVARTWTGEEDELPGYVAINGGAPGAGFLGVEYAPHLIANLDAPLENVNLPEGVGEDRLERRLKALDALNKGFARRSNPARVADHERMTARALRFRKSPALKAFDLSAEKPETLKAYGLTEETPNFAKAGVLTRRLIEAGVRFVEVVLDGWDTHADNFNATANLMKQLDPALASLTRELSERGLLKDTLVLCLGEFGRTPKINGDRGRDHWSDAFSAVLAGGGVKGGQVVGATDAKGELVKERPVTVPDLFATLLSALGVDPTKQYHTPGGRPIRLADKGKVVRELFE
jgi:uncharacterized protein (DUF1501 family)